MSSLLINDINSSSEVIEISKEKSFFLVGGCNPELCDFAPLSSPEIPTFPDF